MVARHSSGKFMFDNHPNTAAMHTAAMLSLYAKASLPYSSCSFQWHFAELKTLACLKIQLICGVRCYKLTSAETEIQVFWWLTSESLESQDSVSISPSLSKTNFSLCLHKLSQMVTLLISAHPRLGLTVLWGQSGEFQVKNTGIPHSKVTKAWMLSHLDFLWRMVQWGKRNSPAPIIQQIAKEPPTVQIHLLWLAILDSFLPSRTRSVSGKDQIPTHLIKVLQRKAKVSEKAKRTGHKRLLLDLAVTLPFFPSFNC